MPLLKFKCSQCDNVFEELVFSDTEIKCPDCGSKADRHYQGKCYAGSTGSGCSGSCSGCSGCK